MATANVQFGYAGKWSPSYLATQEAANLVKSSPAPVGVESYTQTSPYPQQPFYRVVSANEYNLAAQSGRLMYTA